MILYFIPTGSKNKPPKHCTTKRDVQAGPGGKNGVIYSDGKGKTGYYPDNQDWMETDSMYIGIDRDSIVPADLERSEMIDGHFVKLEDGNKWLIPVARVFPVGTKLPESLILGPDGELVAEVLPRFAKFYQDAEKAFEALTGEGDMSIGEAWEIAVKALSLNYHIGRHEVSLLKLLTTANTTEILKAVIDFPVIMEASKKKAVGDCSLSDGNTV